MSEVAKATRKELEYRSALRAAGRAMWLGLMSVEQFTESMMTAIDRGMTNAYREGLKRAGLLPNEATPQEAKLYHEEIWNNVSRIGGLAEFIQAGSKDSGGSWASIESRLTMWAGRYGALRTAVEAMAAGDKKKQWILGRTEEHCRTCYGVAGRVYRNSTWAANNCLPRSQALCCHGFRCDCGLVDTDVRLTPGPFPRSLMCG
jgi:hypothetical protein